MNKIAFFYNSYNGDVTRCMFAGIDSMGRAQWVNITPGEESTTLTEYKEAEGFDDLHYYLLCMDGETTRPKFVAKAMGYMLLSPMYSINEDLEKLIKDMKTLGVQWAAEPLSIKVRVFANGPKSRRAGKYSFIIDDDDDDWLTLANVDGFEEATYIFSWVRTYLWALQEVAGIHVICKKLKIDEQSLQAVGEKELEMFDEIEKE